MVGSQFLDKPLSDAGFRPETEKRLVNCNQIGDLIIHWQAGSLMRMVPQPPGMFEVSSFLARNLHLVLKELDRKTPFEAHCTQPIWTLPTTVRLSNAFNRINLQTIGEFVEKWREDPHFSQLTSVGPTSIKEALRLLAMLVFEDQPHFNHQQKKAVVRKIGLEPMLTEMGIEGNGSAFDAWLEGRCFQESLLSRFSFHDFARIVADEYLERRKSLPTFDGSQPIVAFGFGTRSSKSLATMGIKTAQELVDYWIKDPSLRDLPRVGTLSLIEIFMGINHLFLGGSDEYLVPEGPILDRIVDVVKACVEGSRKERSAKILILRFGLEKNTPQTLEEIGNAMNITRERVRQLEEVLIKRLESLILYRQRYRGKRIPVSMAQQVQKLQEEMAMLGPIFEEQALEQTLTRVLGRDSSMRSPNLSLLLFLLGYKELSAKNQMFSEWTFWARLTFDASEEVMNAMKVSLDALKREEIMERFELRMILRKEYPHVPFTCLDLALNNCPHIQEVGGAFRLARTYIADLRWTIIQYLRMIRKPAHFREIAKHTNELRTLNEGRGVGLGTIGNLLSADPAFMAIGRTGRWALAEWEEYCGDTGVTLIHDFLKSKGKPAHREEIWEYVQSKRDDVPKQSVNTYLNGHKHFIRVAKNLFALEEWGLEPAQREKGVRPKIDRDAIARAAAELLIAVPEHQLPFQKVLKTLKANLNCGDSAIINTLTRCERLKVTNHPDIYNLRVVILLDDDMSKPFFPKPEKLLQIKVKDLVIEAFAKGEERLLLSDLAKQGEKVLGCQRPTFYSYIKKVPGITKISIDGNVWCLYQPPVES